MLRNRIQSKGLALLLVAALLIVLFPVSGNPVQAAGSTYYVDCGSIGNDTNSGTSMSAPWKSLSKVNSTTFGPGDQLLFKAGCSWSGQLHPKGSGSSGAPIILSRYGSGSNPLIQGGGTVGAAIYLYNQQYWEMSNLEVTNNSSTAGNRKGIHVVGKDAGTLRHIHIKNMAVNHVKGDNTNKITGGIIVEVIGTQTVTKFENVLIEGNTLFNVDRTGICTQSTWSGRPAPTSTPWTPWTNVVVRNNSLDDVGGDGIVMRNTDGALVEYNVVKDANKRANTFNVAIWAFNADNTLFQYNEAYLTRTTYDGQGFDVDYKQTGTIFQYNYSHNNEGGFMLVATSGDSTYPVTKDAVVRYNISRNDQARVFEFNGPSENTRIYNNTIYLPQGSTTKPVHVNNWGGYPKSAYFYNNIFHLESAGIWSGLNSFTNEVVFSHNVIYGAHTSGEPNDAHKLTSNPALVLPGSGGVGRGSVDGYKLLQGSPALQSGILITNNGGKDYWGNNVSSTSAPNRGAYNGPGVQAQANGRYEAESYNEGSGIQTEANDGGTVVRNFKWNEYLRFNNVNFGTGITSIELRVASASTEMPVLELRSGGYQGTLLGTLDPLTGGWNTFQTKTMNIVNTSGTKDIWLISKTGGIRVNWLKINGVTIQAEDYSAGSGIVTNAEDGGIVVRDFKWNEYLRFDQVNFGAGTTKIKFRVASASTESPVLELRAGGYNGQVLGTLDPLTGDWNTFQEKTMTITNTSGLQNIWLVSKTGSFKINWFELVP